MFGSNSQCFFLILDSVREVPGFGVGCGERGQRVISLVIGNHACFGSKIEGTLAVALSVGFAGGKLPGGFAFGERFLQREAQLFVTGSFLRFAIVHTVKVHGPVNAVIGRQKSIGLFQI